MDKKLRDTTILCIEIMISKRQVKGKLVTWHKFSFAVGGNRDAYLVIYVRTHRKTTRQWKSTLGFLYLCYLIM